MQTVKFEEAEEEDEDEEEEEGSIGLKTYYKFLSSGHEWLVPILIVLCFATQFTFLCVPYWLAVWSQQDSEEAKDPYYLEVLGFIVLILVVLALLRNNLLYQNILSSSRNLHNMIIRKLARAPVKFFDENSSGKIMGRCSKDIAMMDDFLTWMFTDMIQV